MKFEEVSPSWVITIELSLEEAPLLYWSADRKNWVLEQRHASRYASEEEAQAVAGGLSPRYPEGVSGVVRPQLLASLGAQEAEE